MVRDTVLTVAVAFGAGVVVTGLACLLVCSWHLHEHHKPSNVVESTPLNEAISSVQAAIETVEATRAKLKEDQATDS